MMASCSGEILSPKQSGASPILMGTVWSDIYLDMLYLFRIIIFSEKILFFKISQTNHFNLPLMQHYLHLYANNIQFHYILNDQLIFTGIFYKQGRYVKFSYVDNIKSVKTNCLHKYTIACCQYISYNKVIVDFISVSRILFSHNLIDNMA